MISKRVAVIGAGPSGLATAKELLEQGHRPVCFEKAPGLGGVFRFDPRHGSVWPGCRLTSSGVITAFSDFPVAGERAGHMTAEEYVRYLSDYARVRGVDAACRFGVVVESVERLPDDGWQVTHSSAAGRGTERFDAVAVCSGVHQVPCVPDVPELAEFPGTVLHSSAYRGRAQVEGKRVLVVGAGESGGDIAAEVASCAAKTTLSLRRGVAVVSRMALGKPRDFLTSRLINSPAEWIHQTRNPADDPKRSLYRSIFLPAVVLDKLLQIAYQLFWEWLPLLLAACRERSTIRLRVQALIRELLRESGGSLQEQFGTKDDAFVYALARGACTRAPELVRFDAGKAVFADGSAFEPDVVLFCTGFQTKIPYLDETIASVPRYLNTFVPGVDGSLAFIGFVRPGFGAIAPLAELQARWFALVLSGLRTLPEKEEMAALIDAWTKRRLHQFRAVGDRLAHLVDFTAFCDELAAQVGCKPGREALRQESRALRLRFYAGPFVAAQYRLIGPGARPELARRTIEALPIAHPWPQIANLWLRWRLSRILHRRLGPDYAPKLSVDEP